MGCPNFAEGELLGYPNFVEGELHACRIIPLDMIMSNGSVVLSIIINISLQNQALEESVIKH
jgi:hypothetical protein